MLYLWKEILKRFAKDQNYQKVRDHCHYTGKCRGAAHSICNLKFNVPNEIPVRKRVLRTVWMPGGKY